VFLDRRHKRLEGGAPAAFADFIGVNEIVGRLPAPVALERHLPCDAANAQTSSESLPLDPLCKSHGDVPIEILARFLKR
jgi:hypothetical protein